MTSHDILPTHKKSYPTFPCLQQRSQAIHICHTGAHEASGLGGIEYGTNEELLLMLELYTVFVLVSLSCPFCYILFGGFLCLAIFRSLDLIASSMVFLISLAFLSGFFQTAFNCSKEYADSTCFQCRFGDHEGKNIPYKYNTQPHKYIIYQSFLAPLNAI